MAALIAGLFVRGRDFAPLPTFHFGREMTSSLLWSWILKQPFKPTA